MRICLRLIDMTTNKCACQHQYHQFVVICCVLIFMMSWLWLQRRREATLWYRSKRLLADLCPTSALRTPRFGLLVIGVWQYISANRLRYVNTLRPRQNGPHFAGDLFKCNFVNENIWISIKISLKFVSKAPISNIPALVQIMVWWRPSDTSFSQPMIAQLTDAYIRHLASID